MPLTTPFTRRAMLRHSACGFGSLALAALCSSSPGAPRPVHFRPRAKRIIFLFMHGGPSQIDTFDYKPQLEKDDGKDLPFEPAENLSRGIQRTMMKSPWAFRRYGESGRWISDLFPHIARHADLLSMVHSMHTDGQSHGQAVMRLHTGENTFVRPSLGAWLSYGLGTENANLPAFVTICPPRGHGGVRNYGSAFLPARHQGTAIGSAGTPAAKARIAFLESRLAGQPRQQIQLDFLQQLNRRHLERSQGDPQIEGVIRSFELAYRMQTEAPQVLDLSSETEHTRRQYGIGEKPTDDFGTQCLLARRLAEAGVRFVQVSHSFKWDQHSQLEQGHQRNAAEVDRPIAALLTDLKQRGMLDDTLVWWGGEFGRTPMIEGSNGRDHNPQGFTMWLAGAGVRAGYAHGATDDYGYFAVQDKVHMHDLHATLLHLLGLDHTRLTYRYAGRDFRLTDVYGNVVEPILG